MRKTPCICRWLYCANRYGKNPNTTPAISAGTTSPVLALTRPNIVTQLSTQPARIREVYAVATGTPAQMNGAASRPGNKVRSDQRNVLGSGKKMRPS